MDDVYFKKIMTLLVLGGLLVLSYFLIKPLLLSIIFGIILAFIFTPIYNWLYKKIKNKNLAASIICVVFFLIILIPIIFLTPVLVDQSIKLYMASQQLDLVTPFKKIFPYLFVSEQFSGDIASTVHSFVTKLTNSLMNSLAQIILDLPTILLNLIIVFFILFYAVRDKEKIIGYVKSILPFSSDIETKLFKASKEITASVIYGMIIIGTMQGIIMGIGFFIFNVPNAWLLSLFAVVAGILPIIGPAVVWVPVGIYLLIGGNTFAALGMVVFGLLSHIPDNLVRPLFLSKMTDLNPAIALIGMIGGVFLFGILGIFLGPLILSYMFILLDLFKKKI